MKRSFTSGMYQGCGIALSLVFISIILLQFLYNKASFFIDKYIFAEQSINTDQISAVKTLLESNVIIPADTVLTQTLEYYDTLITVLVAILGIVGVVAFFYIRGSSEEKAKEYAEKYAKEYFNTIDFDEIVKRNVSKAFDSDYGANLEHLSEKVGKLDTITKSVDERLKSIEELNKEITKVK